MAGAKEQEGWTSGREAQTQGHTLAGWVGVLPAFRPLLLGQGWGWMLTPGADVALRLCVTARGLGHGGLP